MSWPTVSGRGQVLPWISDDRVMKAEIRIKKKKKKRNCQKNKFFKKIFISPTNRLYSELGKGDIF